MKFDLQKIEAYFTTLLSHQITIYLNLISNNLVHLVRDIGSLGATAKTGLSRSL